jgi:hypothetical protein
MRSAAELDARSLALHRLVVLRISSDQSLFEKVRETLDRYRSNGCWLPLKTDPLRAAISI